MTDPDRTAELHARADKIRKEMGGSDKLSKMADEGNRTIREHIDGFLDAGSFRYDLTSVKKLLVMERLVGMEP